MIAPFIGTMPNGSLRQYGGLARVGSWDGERYIFVREGKSYKVARLVCEAFNGAPSFLRAVCMHIDENAKTIRQQI
jgi:hypothetical protein